MSLHSNGIIRLTKADIKRAAGVIAKAFQDYPLSVYFIPDDSKRRKKQPAIFRPMISRGLKYGEVYTTSPKFEGVAVWFRSTTGRDSIWSMFSFGFLVIPFITGISNSIRQISFGLRTESIRKRVAPVPHLHLQLLGVDPVYQGQGFSSKLLRPMLARADKEGIPCFLETQAEKNVALYEHFGFRVVDEWKKAGTDIHSWAMLRGKVD
jgi:GNAT superfamily N-acetyltransferase